MKAKLVIFGNCQGIALHKALTSLPHVTDRYEVIRHDVLIKGAELAASLPDYEVAEIILVQNIFLWRSHPMKDRLPASARVVVFPGLAHLAIWPFDSIVDGPDPAFVQFEPFIFGDRFMARLRGSVPDSAGCVPDPAERLAVYRSLDWPTAPTSEELRRNAAFERSRVLRLDEKLGSRLGRFVTDNYRSMRLFHAVHHPSQALMVEFVAEVLTKAGLYDNAIRDMDLDVVNEFQAPIHPRVVEALELEWVEPGALYRFKDDIYLDFDSYYRLYIESYG
jgi:hypothetical protein